MRGHVLVETTGGRYLAVLRGPVPVPNTEDEADEVIEVLLDIGLRLAAEKGETLVRVLSPETEASVEFIADEAPS